MLARKTGGRNYDFRTGTRIGGVYRLLCGMQRDEPTTDPGDLGRVEERLEKAGERPTHIEGYKQAEWVLLDYVNFVVHVFSVKARKFYDLERLWKSAKRLQPSDLAKTKRTAARSIAKKRA